MEVRVRGGVKVRCGEGVEVREGRLDMTESVRTIREDRDGKEYNRVLESY